MNLVVAAVAFDDVSAIAAKKLVVFAAAQEAVVVVIAVEDVCAGSAVENVIAGAAAELISAVVAVHDVVASAAVGGVVAAAALEGVVAIAGIHQSSAGAQDDLVRSAAAKDGDLPAASGDVVIAKGEIRGMEDGIEIAVNLGRYSDVAVNQNGVVDHARIGRKRRSRAAAAFGIDFGDADEVLRIPEHLHANALGARRIAGLRLEMRNLDVFIDVACVAVNAIGSIRPDVQR